MYKDFYNAFSYNYSTTFVCGKNKYYDNACFSAIFGNLTHYSKIRVFICTDDSLISRNKGNYCPLTVKEMRSWMDACKRVVNITYRFDKGICNFNDGNIRYYSTLKDVCSEGYWCTIWFPKETNEAKRRYVLTWIRYMYEGLYCPYVYLTYRIHEKDGYKGIPLRKIFLNLLYVFNEYTTGHSFGIVHYDSNKIVSKNLIGIRLNNAFNTRDYIASDKRLLRPKTFHDLYTYNLDKLIEACNNFKE